MKSLILTFALSALALAHFAFVTVNTSGQRAQLVLSEDLLPDPGVNIDMLKDARLFARDAAGADKPLTLKKTGDAMIANIPGKGVRFVHGLADLGVSSRGGKTFLLLYHPKSLVGEQFGETATIGGKPVELVPYGKPGEVRLLLLSEGKPTPNAEVTVNLPEGKDLKVKTDAEGFTPVLTATGRFGAWARYWDPAGKGERDGRAFDETRHYATLVFDAFPAVSNWTKMPEAAASFGAAAGDGYVYVYGGHTARTHSYDTKSVSGKFVRMNLANREWETLPGGPTLQGMNLAYHQGKVFRVGGMMPHNAPGEKVDNRSVDTVAWFDTASKEWKPLPNLPEPRSSHDVAVVGSKLVVTGGWNMREGGETPWHNTTLVLDLAAAKPEWQTVPQPFQRRALITAVHRNKLYVLGGIQPNGSVNSDVDVFDPASNTWSKGPALPGTGNDNFAPAAAVLKEKLYVSLGDGGLYRLHDTAGQWQPVARTSARVAHRMVPVGDHLLVLGGAVKGNNLDLVEVVAVR